MNDSAVQMHLRSVRAHPVPLMPARVGCCYCNWLVSTRLVVQFYVTNGLERRRGAIQHMQAGQRDPGSGLEGPL